MNIPPGNWEQRRDRDLSGGSSLVRNWRGAAIRALTRRNKLAVSSAQGVAVERAEILSAQRNERYFAGTGAVRKLG